MNLVNYSDSEDEKIEQSITMKEKNIAIEKQSQQKCKDFNSDTLQNITIISAEEILQKIQKSDFKEYNKDQKQTSENDKYPNNYSLQNDNEQQICENDLKRKNPQKRTIDSEEKQPSKIRKIAHKDGCFAGYVYADLQFLRDQFQIVTQAIEQFMKINKIEDVNFAKFTENFHISLTKTFYLYYTCLEEYKLDLLQNLQLQHRCVCALKLNQVSIYQGDNDRTFIAIDILIGKQGLDKLVDCIDLTQRAYHISIMWTDKVIQQNSQMIDNLNSYLLKNISDKAHYFTIDSIVLKIGQKTTPLKLQ